jgi:hypothetical protein
VWVAFDVRTFLAVSCSLLLSHAVKCHAEEEKRTARLAEAESELKELRKANEEVHGVLFDSAQLISALDDTRARYLLQLGRQLLSSVHNRGKVERYLERAARLGNVEARQLLAEFRHVRASQGH